MSFVLHCLPGPMEAKAVAVSNAAAVLEPDGVLFGDTVLGLDEPHTAPARAFIKGVNRRGLFDTRGDTREGLEAIIAGSFTDFEVDVVGSLAMFTAGNPIRA